MTIIKRAIRSIKKYGVKEVPYILLKFFRGIGLFSKNNIIRAYWHEMSNLRNFGDMITPYLIKKISNKNAYFANEYCVKDYFICAGSVLEKSSKNAIIWGAGIMDPNVKIEKPKKILAIRGPLTRKRIIDSGYMNVQKNMEIRAYYSLYFIIPRLKKI